MEIPSDEEIEAWELCDPRIKIYTRRLESLLLMFVDW